ncbi:hypothetical protein SCLCIDRAFT_132297, partial [Scleroderma citrinum Foug A]
NHFRILIVGRSDAGKTTTLQRVCAITEHPKSLMGRGKRCDKIPYLRLLADTSQQEERSIENELVFGTNSGVIFHDSCKFKSGSVDELTTLRQTGQHVRSMPCHFRRRRF